MKKRHVLREDDIIAEHMIPTTFHKEIEFLSDSNLNSLKRHYMTFHWKESKDFLDFIEDSMPLACDLDDSTFRSYEMTLE
jgi:hypothetical protein